MGLFGPLTAGDWTADTTTAWRTGSGSGVVELRADYLSDFGVEVLSSDEPVRDRRFLPLSLIDSRLWIYAPFGNFEGFTGGALELHSGLTLRHGNQIVALNALYLLPAEQQELAILQLHDSAGNHLANITHMHVALDRLEQRMTVRHADITASPRLAAMLGQPALTGLSLGVLELDLAFSMPDQARLAVQASDSFPMAVLPGCEGRPKWPQAGHEVDVALTGMSIIQYQGTEPDTGRLKIAPSATLRNVGVADVPWIRPFFSIELYPYQPRDQHPFLVWNLYRIHDGRLEQLAASGVKHAFFARNSQCNVNCSVDFQGDFILWPGCTDVYSQSTNDLNHRQGPRHEVTPHLGLWDNCKSFFDPGCEGTATREAGDWQHRLLVDPEELGHAGADYFFDAWYVIQFDINIWNSMGYHRIKPESLESNGWTFSPGDFQQGSPVSEWVPENTLSASAGHRLIVVESETPDAPYPDNMPLGHVRALARVEELEDGRFRYRYAIMNFDLSRGLHEFRIPLPLDASLDEASMGGPPDVLETVWPHERSSAWVHFRAPAGHSLPWFTLYHFEIVTDKPPSTRGSVVMISENEDSDNEEDRLILEARLPIPDPSLFQDRFE